MAEPARASRDDELERRSGRMFMEVTRRTHLSPAHELSAVVADEARSIGATSLVLYLVDYEQRMLVPLPGPAGSDREPIAVQGTVAGRCFAASTIVDVPAAQERRLWVPLLDGTERLGVMEIALSGVSEMSDALLAVCERYAHFVAGLIVTKNPYSDVFKMLRRRRSMTPASELVREMVPPSVMATDDFVLGAMLEPAYDVGGDAYDYALNGDVLHMGIFDGVGHGLAAAGVTTFAVAVYRHGRRAERPLGDLYEAIDVEIEQQYPTNRYVTACLAELHVCTGWLRWISAGHPAPLLVRRGRFIKELTAPPSPPMGLRLSEDRPAVGEERLEPGDMVLLYTDGLTEARRPDGRLFTSELLAEFLERQAGSGDPAPETLRRLREAIIDRGHGQLRDDATAVLLEWRSGTQRRLLPPTADSSTNR